MFRFLQIAGLLFFYSIAFNVLADAPIVIQPNDFISRVNGLNSAVQQNLAAQMKQLLHGGKTLSSSPVESSVPESSAVSSSPPATVSSPAPDSSSSNTNSTDSANSATTGGTPSTTQLNPY